MGLKKKSKINAQFNMSSLTDIIFLLLIFFMLTSSLIVPNALNLKLPGKSQTPPAVSQQPTSISINSNGSYFINGKRVSISNLETAVSRLRTRGHKVSIIISPSPNVANEHVVAVMDIAFRYGVEAILVDPSAPATVMGPHFQARNGYLEAVDENVFAQDPSALLEIFQILEENLDLKGVNARTIALIRQHPTRRDLQPFARQARARYSAGVRDARPRARRLLVEDDLPRSHRRRARFLPDVYHVR